MDRGLPAIEGLDVLGRLRRKGITAPALILSARSNPADRVECLDRGAEDYWGKPFDIDELLARIRALLRRHADSAATVRVPGGSLDVGTRTVALDDGGVVDTYVHYLSKKLGRSAVLTVRGLGYLLGPLA